VFATPLGLPGYDALSLSPCKAAHVTGASARTAPGASIHKPRASPPLSFSFPPHSQAHLALPAMKSLRFLSAPHLDNIGAMHVPNEWLPRQRQSVRCMSTAPPNLDATYVPESARCIAAVHISHGCFGGDKISVPCPSCSMYVSSIPYRLLPRTVLKSSPPPIGATYTSDCYSTHRASREVFRFTRLFVCRSQSWTQRFTRLSLQVTALDTVRQCTRICSTIALPFFNESLICKIALEEE
jgi:hypothetical protein